jgi:hypothetical protein
MSDKHFSSDCIEPMSSDEEDDESGSLGEQLESLMDLMESLVKDIGRVETELARLQPHMEDLYVNQLSEIPFLETSPFRFETFLVKPPGFPGIDLKKRYPFHEICSLLRTYLIESNSINEEGMVLPNKLLRKFFGRSLKPISFLQLLGLLRAVLI